MESSDALDSRSDYLFDAMTAFDEATDDLARLFETIALCAGAVTGSSCSVLILSDDKERLEIAAMRHPDSEIDAQLRRDFLLQPLVLAEHPVMRPVIEDGQHVWIPHLDVDKLEPTSTPQYFELVKHLGLHSLLMVPLRARNQTLGMLSLVRYRDREAFDARDVKFAQSLANHAALAIANGRSFDAEKKAHAAAERAQEELRHSEARHQLIFDKSPLPEFIYDVEAMRITDVNAAALQLYGYSREEFLALDPLVLLAPGETPRPEWGTARLGSEEVGARKHRKKNGALITVDCTIHTLLIDGRLMRMSLCNDISGRLALEEQLRQSQKMEAIGRLAGGVAHDFNNLLSVILSYSEMTIEDLPPDASLRADLEQIQQAARRAGGLTRQLLMFSRQQVLEPRVLLLNDLIDNMMPMLERLLGEDIELRSLLSPALGAVRVDPGSIEQLVMNLVINSRDAMPTGGKLTLETENVILDDEYARQHLGAVAGPHVMLAVSDSGLGMDRATQERMFEPFFTTKEAGKGTGLGLSTVFGIAQQSGGTIWVYSEPGKGTTFKIYLRRVDSAVEVRLAPSHVISLRGNETILLVEDDDQVRAAARGILTRCGYQVLEARRGAEALAISAKPGAKIDLLLSDVVMPQMSGPELARELCRARPSIKVLFMSGYTDDSVLRHGVLESNTSYVQKPLTTDTLARKVRAVLDAAAP